MVKIRLQGTTNEIKRMRRVIERNRSLLVVSTSEVFPNKGTKKYFRQYMDISFDPVKKEISYPSSPLRLLRKMEETNMNEVNENVTVNGAGTQDEEPAAKNNETKAEKFIRLGEYRMNKAIDAIGRLEHLANRSAYEYTAEQVEAMFGALENKVAGVKAKFSTKKQDNTSFSFGTHAE